MTHPDDTKPIWRAYRVFDRKNREVYSARRFNDLQVKGSGDGLLWSQVGAGPPYTVYCREQDAAGYGYIGQTETLGFVNDRFAPDYDAPPIADLKPQIIAPKRSLFERVFG